MKKTLLNMFLIAFVTVSFAGHSWAFGSRGHHDGQHNNGGQGDDFFSGNGPDGNFDNDDNDNNFRQHDFINGDNGTNDNSLSNTDDNGLDLTNDVNGDLPSAPVPEPMTLPLVGMGLVGLLLVRNMRSNKI
jgi:hypothetical protein